MIHLVYSDKNGNLHVDKNLAAAGSVGSITTPILDYIPLPEGATLTSLPGRAPLGFDVTGQLRTPETKKEAWAVGVLLPQGFTRTANPAYRKFGAPDVLPLLGYTALGMYKNKLVIAAIQTDTHDRWHPKHFNSPDLPERVARLQNKFPDNRLFKQLGYCSLEYGCFTAQNIFYRRWEGGLPVSPACNANCLGCISLQESECCPSPQGRIKFSPTVKEGTEVALYHLTGKRTNNIISFGQGCEGEPSLNDKAICGIIKNVRNHTQNGTININTNAGHTEKIKKIVDSGIDTIRTSLISAIPDHYNSYYRQKAYTIEDVEKSLAYGVENGVYVSLNLLTLPGFTDREDEIEALLNLIRRTGIQKVQIRNLNIDEDWFYKKLHLKKQKSLGILSLLDALTGEGIEIGNFTRCLESN